MRDREGQPKPGRRRRTLPPPPAADSVSLSLSRRNHPYVTLVLSRATLTKSRASRAHPGQLSECRSGCASRSSSVCRRMDLLNFGNHNCVESFTLPDEDTALSIDCES